MPEPLWKIRERKGMSVNQLAAKSGVPAISINEYETGRTIRSADLPKLAKALFVEEWDIAIEGPPRPKPARRGPPTPPPDTAPEPERAKPRAAKRLKSAQPARPSQIEHLLTLTERHFGKDRTALETELGRPLEQMTRREASQMLSEYQQVLSQSRPAETEEPGEVKRKRAYLPESVDEFELNYLTAHQEAGTPIRFTLFDGREMTGAVVGFSPYSITLQEAESGDEITLQKLAIAYYRISGSTAAKQPPTQLGGDES
jgi:transcriptional regulator with XRE-family HTH domain/sRNA-binding regulator protein Hfq